MKHLFYLIFSIWGIIAAVLGFWPGYFGKMSSGDMEIPWIIHVHALVFVGWIALFFVQALYVYQKKVAIHMRLGQWGIYYGIMLIVLGLVTGLLMSQFHHNQGNDARVTFSIGASIHDMIYFGGFFFVAMYFRHKNTQIHKAWILGATAYLLMPAIFRMNSRFFEGDLIYFYCFLLVPVTIAMILNWKDNKYIWQYLLIMGIMFFATYYTFSLVVGLFR